MPSNTKTENSNNKVLNQNSQDAQHLSSQSTETALSSTQDNNQEKLSRKSTSSPKSDLDNPNIDGHDFLDTAASLVDKNISDDMKMKLQGDVTNSSRKTEADFGIKTLQEGGSELEKNQTSDSYFNNENWNSVNSSKQTDNSSKEFPEISSRSTVGETEESICDGNSSDTGVFFCQFFSASFCLRVVEMILKDHSTKARKALLSWLPESDGMFYMFVFFIQQF